MYAVNTRLKLQGVQFENAAKKDGSAITKTNTKQQQYTGIIQCLFKITTEEGLLTLWNGTLTSIILCFNPAINLGIYMMLKRHRFLIDISDNHSDSIAPFISSFISKFMATIVTYPVQVLQTRHRASIKIKEGTSNQQSLLSSLYRGLNSKLLQTCLNSAIMFVLYERLIDILTAHLLVN